MKLQKILRVCALFALLALGVLTAGSVAHAASMLSVTDLLNADGTLDSLIEQPSPNAAQLLQFTAGGHALGFARNGIYVASADHALRVQFVGANAVTPQSDATNQTTVHSARNPQAAALTRVTYANLWDGITLTYDQGGGILRSTYRIEAGADVNAIRLQYNAPITLNADGSLTTKFETGVINETAPIAWQDINGARVPVSVKFVLDDFSSSLIPHLKRSESSLTFALGAYDASQPLWIDPTLTWNTFLGGNGYDYGTDIAVDANGNVYVAGWSNATWGSPVRAFSGYFDAFAAKLDANGNLTWNTFLGGSRYAEGYGIAVDANGNVYVAGYSDGTWGSPVRAFSGNRDAYAAKLDANGALTWHTFLGSSGNDDSIDIVVDANGNVYVAGYSNATWGAPVRAFSGDIDAFAAKLDSNGNLTWNTFLGGSSDDHGYSIAVDANGNVYVAGASDVTWGSPVRAFSGGGGYDDAFSAKLDANGNLTWNTFLGGSRSDGGYSIAVDANRNVYVSGYSNATWGSPVRAFSGDSDAFTAKLAANGALTWNTFLGGSGDDDGDDIEVDANGNVYVVGYSDATWGSPVRAFSGDSDAFTAKLAANGALTWNTFLGGSGYAEGYGIAVDTDGNVYVAGYSDGTWGSPVNGYSDADDAFAVKLGSACATKPAKPTLNLPAKNASVTKPKVNLKWNDVSCETEYRVKVKNAATNQPVFQSTLGADVTLIKTTRLAKGQTYKWFVQACNTYGCANSAKWKFFIKP